MMLYPVMNSFWFDDDDCGYMTDGWGTKAGTTAPAVNVKENDREYEVELAVPGATKNDFQVSVDKDGCLSIKLERSNAENKDNTPVRYLRREFTYANYEQLLQLPDDVDRESISARVEDGILHVTLPRRVERQDVRRQIEVA